MDETQHLAVSIAPTTGEMGKAETALPPEILPEIAKFVGSSTDLISFSLMNKYAHHLLLPQVYEYLDLKSEQCIDGLLWLFAHPSIASRVNTLILRPSHDFLVSHKLDQHQWKRLLTPTLLNTIPYLRELRTFCWDDLISPDDRIWRALRVSCPQLRAIGSTFGPREDPELQKSLFKFSNLGSFSFVPRWHELDFPFNHGENFVHSFESYPDEMWTMLKRSPSLESLTIGVPLSIVHARIFDITPLLRCVSKWASLRSLTLGYSHISNEHIYSSDPSVANLTFAEFLDVQAPALRHLSLAGVISDSPVARRKEYPSSHLTTRDVEGLETYQGPLPLFTPFRSGSAAGDVEGNQPHSALALEFGLNIIQGGVDVLRWRSEVAPLSKLPRLVDLRLCAEPIRTFHQLREVGWWLKSLTYLETFAVWLDFSSGVNLPESVGVYPGEPNTPNTLGGVFRPVFDNLPRWLIHLEVRCSTDVLNTFKMSVLSHCFQSPFPRLRSFAITKVSPKHFDQDMLTTASNIFKSALFPQLNIVTLRYARKSWSSYEMTKIHSIGVYKRLLAPLNGPHPSPPSQSSKSHSTTLQAEEWYPPYFEETITLQAQTAWSLKAEENVNFPRRSGSLGQEFSMQTSVALDPLPEYRERGTPRSPLCFGEISIREHKRFVHVLEI